MSKPLKVIKDLVSNQNVRISSHGYDELAADGILVREIISSIAEAQLVEDYPNYPKGPCILVLQKNRDGNPFHVVWGIPKGTSSPAVLVTAYRPDPIQWTSDFMRRKL